MAYLDIIRLSREEQLVERLTVAALTGTVNRWLRINATDLDTALAGIWTGYAEMLLAKGTITVPVA